MTTTGQAPLSSDTIQVARTAVRAEIEDLLSVAHACDDYLRYGDRLGVLVKAALLAKIRDYVNSAEYDIRSRIITLLDSDATAGDLRKALAELVGR